MNLIIMGKSRCGKTTLANMICKQFTGYSKISMDYLVMAFKKTFNNLDLKYYSSKENDFSAFLEEYFDNCIYKDNSIGLYYILEGADLPIECVLRLKNKPNTKVIYLGKPNLTPKEFFDEIRFYEKGLETGGWTKRLDDTTLLSWCTDWIKKSKEYELFCKQNDILFFDTSTNQNDVLNQILEKLKEK